MFRRRNAAAVARPVPEPFTYIHKGTVLTGDVSASGRLRVHGTVRGDVTVSGVLEVAESGLVEARRVEADEVKIIGMVVAACVIARGRVEIWKGGELRGDVRAASLDIEDGARFTGRSEMLLDQQPAPGDEPPARAQDGATAALPAAAAPPALPEAAARAPDPVTEADLL